MKLFIFTVFCVGITVFIGCMATMPIHTEQDVQQLEEAKELFKRQFENDMHPIIWAYLDEVRLDDATRKTSARSQFFSLATFRIHPRELSCDSTL